MSANIDHWLSEGGSFRVPGSPRWTENPQHPWLTDLRAMVRLLRGEIEPPHSAFSLNGSSSCPTCDNARRLQAEARTVADVQIVAAYDPYDTREPYRQVLVLCKHGHLFTPCEWCEYDKKWMNNPHVSYHVGPEWHDSANPDRVYGMDLNEIERYLQR